RTLCSDRGRDAAPISAGRKRPGTRLPNLPVEAAEVQSGFQPDEAVADSLLRRVPQTLRACEFPQLIVGGIGFLVGVDRFPWLGQRDGVVDGNAIFKDARADEADALLGCHLLAVRRRTIDEGVRV